MLTMTVMTMPVESNRPLGATRCQTNEHSDFEHVLVFWLKRNDNEMKWPRFWKGDIHVSFISIFNYLQKRQSCINFERTSCLGPYLKIYLWLNFFF